MKGNTSWLQLMTDKEIKMKSNKGLKQDRKRRSKEDWERGRGARKIGNPRYKPVRVRGKDDVIRKVYKLRARK